MREQFAMAYAAGFTTEAVNTGWHYFDGFPEPQSEYVALLQTWGTLRQAAHPASVLWGTIDDSINAYCSVHSPGGS